MDFLETDINYRVKIKHLIDIQNQISVQPENLCELRE